MHAGNSDKFVYICLFCMFDIYIFTYGSKYHSQNEIINKNESNCVAEK